MLRLILAMPSVGKLKPANIYFSAKLYMGHWYPGGDKTYLTKDSRRTMNELVIKVNDKIKETIGERGHGDKVVFVDIDPFVRVLQGRFCQPGIKEPSPNRHGLLFYNRQTYDGTEDEWVHDDLKRSGEQLSAKSFEGQIALRQEEVLKEHPNWKPSDWSSPDEGDQTAEDDSANAVAEAMKTLDPTTLIKDTSMRGVHPRPFLHGIIALLTLFHIVNDNAHSIGLPYDTLMVRGQAPSKDYYKRGPAGPPQGLKCFERPYAVHKEKTNDGSTSVLDAIKDFCKHRNDREVTTEKPIYDR